MTIGVLALQGDFARHLDAFRTLGTPAREVREPRELAGLRALVLPGGESTSMLTLMERTGMEDALRRFHAAGGSLLATCAGVILLAKGVSGPAQRSLGLLDVDVARNGYGRQKDSFETDIEWTEDPGGIRGVFIRAPRITRVGGDVRVLARHAGDPVLVREGRVLGATFHPEITADTRVHRYFLERVAAQARVERVA